MSKSIVHIIDKIEEAFIRQDRFFTLVSYTLNFAALSAWFMGLFAGFTFLTFYRNEYWWSGYLWIIFWAAVALTTVGWLEKFYDTPTDSQHRGEYPGAIARNIFAISVVSLFCLLAIKAFLVIVPDPEQDFGYKIEQDREGICWDATLNTSISHLTRVLSDEYRSHNRFFWVPWYHASVDEKISESLRSTYEKSRSKVLSTISLHQSFHARLDETESSDNEDQTAKELKRRFLPLGGCLTTSENVNAWVVPNAFEHQVTLSLNDRPLQLVGKRDFGVDRTVSKDSMLTAFFTYVIPTDLPNSNEFLRPSRLNVRLGLTNTDEPLLFEFPLPYDFSEIVAFNRFREIFPLPEDLPKFDLAKKRLSEEKLVPEAIRQTFQNLDFSKFPVRTRASPYTPPAGIDSLLLATVVSAVDLLLAFAYLGVLSRLFWGPVRRIRSFIQSSHLAKHWATRPSTSEEPRKNEPIRDTPSSEVDERAILPIRRKLIRWYLLAVLFVVLFVPWKNFRIASMSYGYSVLFLPPNDYAVVDYGKVFLELIAVTCITGLIWLIQEKRATGKPKIPVDPS